MVFPICCHSFFSRQRVDFSHTFTFTALSVGGNSSIFTHSATLNRIKVGFPCVASALSIGSGCCFLHIILLLLNRFDMVFLILLLIFLQAFNIFSACCLSLRFGYLAAIPF